MSIIPFSGNILGFKLDGICLYIEENRKDLLPFDLEVRHVLCTTSRRQHELKEHLGDRCESHLIDPKFFAIFEGADSFLQQFTIKAIGKVAAS